MSTTHEALVGLLKPYVAQAEDLTRSPDRVFLAGLGIDSADLINVIVDAEEHFGCTLELEGLARLVTLEDLVTAIEQARGAA